jgi:dipeptidyl aminopeptidase/acylaminoacyl peptidase
MKTTRRDMMIGKLAGRCCLVAATALVALGSVGAWAQTSIEDLFRNSRFNSATLSPNGKYLATTTNLEGRIQLTVAELETGATKNVAGYDKLDVTGVQWINDERLTFSVIDRDGEQTSSADGLYAINRDGTQSAILMEAPGLLRGRIDGATWASEPRWMSMLGRPLRDDPNGVVAVGQFPNRDAVPYRVDSRTGKRMEIGFDVKGLARGFVVDQGNQLRVVQTTNADQSRAVVWYRDKDGKDWRKLAEYATFEPTLKVLAFDADDTTMIVSAPTAEGRWGIYQYDFAANRPGALLASDKSVDVDGGLVFAPDARKLLGIRMQTEPPKTLWLDKGMANLQAGVDKAFPGLVNVIHPGNAGAPMLIHSYSSTHPGQYALYHPDKKKLQSLLATRPWIDPNKMAPQLVYDYAARDGLPIMAYLTLPAGRAAKALPLVVNVHGGPWARDNFGYNPEVQFLAGMGYAVLQPQFRGSTGFGDMHFRKSFGQWGLSMQDDITDGVNSLVRQGVVDPKRVCIMGASYGGYAAMMGLVKDPDLYRCGVNLFGVTNLFYHSSASRSDDRVLSYGMNVLLGDPDKLRDQLNATSPSKHADRIMAPVFMAYGEKDYRVPLVHGEEMRDGLKKNSKTLEYLELANEEHGIAKEETRYRVYGAIEKFLRQYNPPQ